MLTFMLTRVAFSAAAAYTVYLLVLPFAHQATDALNTLANVLRVVP